MKTILFVGGTGAQGAAIIRILVSTGQYRILLFTRDVKSKHSTDLIATGHVEGIENKAEHGYDLAAFELAVSRSDGVYINTDGFALGEQAETYWGIRLYESAVKCGRSTYCTVGWTTVGGAQDTIRHFMSATIRAKPECRVSLPCVTIFPVEQS
ncbi:gb [Venturia nashicola]|nr:gb [Venturia nashicola]